MKPAEIRELSTEELIKKESELREDVFRLRFKLSTGELEDTSKIKQAKKDIARIKTILGQRESEVVNGK
ncbi:MAG: 50S ribosomal protein L29 [Deferribacterales bacterium]|nr:50S ribosomal protein L29 [Deferribacterales bacterium]